MSKTKQSTVFSVRLPEDAKRRAEQAYRSLGLKNRNQLMLRLIYRVIGYLDPDPALVNVWKEHLGQLRGGYSNINQIAKSAKNGTVIWTDSDRQDVERLYAGIVEMRRDLKSLVLAARQNRDPESAIRRILKDDCYDG